MTVGQIMILWEETQRRSVPVDRRQPASSQDLLEWLPGAEVEHRRA